LLVSRPARVEDVHDLAGFGYKQRLDRTLGGFSAFAAGFSYLSVLTGSTQLFHLGYAAGGPAFFWTWPVAFAGQLLVALCFAEMAARYPLSGGVYQWSKQIGSESVGWMAGWVFLACSVITLASTALALQSALPQVAPWLQFFGDANDRAAGARNAVVLACILIGATTLINAFGVRLMARINNVGVFAELAGVILLIVLLASRARRGLGVVLDTQDRGVGHPLGYFGPACAAALMASFVLYGFDTAGSLAEETEEPRKRAPRAILTSLVAVGTTGTLLVLSALLAVSDLRLPQLSQPGGGLSFIVKDALGSRLGTALLCDVAFAIIVCTLTVHTAAVRLVFAMARDNNLPGASALARVHVTTRTPALPALLIGFAAAVILVLNMNFPQVIEVLASVAVVWANLAYMFVTVPLLRLRLKGWPRSADGAATGLFSLGRWGLAVNVLAVIWGGFVVVNIGWPRAEIYGTGWLRLMAAPLATAALLGSGLIYERTVRRHRSGILEEHRVEAPAGLEAIEGA
jgi:urea carboxylase system permease